MEESLIRIVENMRWPRVLVVGDLMLDRYIWGETERISPEAPIPILRVTQSEERLGGAAGVASIVRGLEAEVSLVGVLGNDPIGHRCMEMLASQGVDTSNIVVDSTLRTTVKERYFGRVGPQNQQQVMRVDYDAEDRLADGLVQQMFASLHDQVKAHDIVIVSDYCRGTCQPGLIRALIRECSSRKIRILVDPSRKSHDLSHYRGCSTLTPNRLEAGLAAGVTVADIQTGCEAAKRLRESLALEVGLVTLDADGMTLADEQGQHHFAAERRHVRDVTGAGDVALAVLGMVLASGFGYADAVRLANVAAGISVERVGVSMVSRGEIIADLMRRLRKETLITKEFLTREMQRLRQIGRKIVFTNGCFDLLHSGHIHLLTEARALGDLLVVGLNSDASVRRLGKGQGRPINDQYARGRVLSALGCVDYVCVFEEDTPWELIQAVRPDVLVKGADYIAENVVGKQFVESYGGRLHLVALRPEQSTTGTIERIRNS